MAYKHLRLSYKFLLLSREVSRFGQRHVSLRPFEQILDRSIQFLLLGFGQHRGQPERLGRLHRTGNGLGRGRLIGGGFARLRFGPRRSGLRLGKGWRLLRLRFRLRRRLDRDVLGGLNRRFDLLRRQIDLGRSGLWKSGFFMPEQAALAGEASADQRN